MNTGLVKGRRLESLLAVVLRYGTWLASALTALGLALAFLEDRSGTHQTAASEGMRIVVSGIAVFILLPTLRVLLMLIVFVRERDYRLVAISATVLVIILMGFVLGRHMAKS